ncbi:MAG: glycine cleavage system protein GcvH [Alphaproteobacteria bacterium]
MLRYTKDHEWVRMDGEIATIGITPYAQEKLGDLVYVELPKIGAKFTQGAAIAVVESVKAASDVYAPISGEVIAVNDLLTKEPELVNSEPTGEGWLFKMKISNAVELASLLDEIAYRALTGDH